jgi:putative ABC transport system permease protein
MILLRLISWQYARKHLLRTALTAAGIVLGVAVYVGIHTANQSVLFAFQKTVDRIAGAAQLQVMAGETGFPEEVLERIQSAPNVRVAVPVIEAMVQTGLEGQGNLMILGVDMTGDRGLREYDLESGEEAVVDDPLVFLAQPDSLIVTNTFAARNRLESGSAVTLRTMEGEKKFTVRGIMRSGGLTSAFGGNLAVMDIYAAQKVFGRGRRFDRVDLAVNDGVRVEDVQARLQNQLGPGFQVETPSSRGQHFESLLSVYSMTANITSLFALFIGVFIIYNTFAIAVTQRRSEIGILRALGASRAQIRTLFLGEGAVIGIVGSILGVFFGIAIARGISGYIGGLLGEIYGVGERAQEITTNPTLIGFAVAIGILSSIVAALVPARNAARVDPVRALQKGKYQMLSAGESRARRIAAAIAIAAALACIGFSRHPVLFYLGYLLSILAALLLTPALALWLSKILRPPLKRLWPVEGVLAADSLIQAPRRTSGVVAALMLSIALVIGMGGLARASYASILDWMGTALNPDLFLTTSETLTSRAFRFPASMEAMVREVEGVDEIQAVRSARVLYRGSPVMLVAVDIESVARRASREPVAGNKEEMYRLTAAGEGVIASDNFAIMKGLKLGDLVEIAAPSGVLRLPIAGIVVDYSDQQGSLLINRAVFRKFWNDDTINVFRIYLKPGAPEEKVKQRIYSRFSGQMRLIVLTNQEVRRWILKLTDQWLGLTYIQIAVAVLVAVLGIVNTLTVSITDRRRELGVLQAVGGLRKQIRRTVWVEALSIGAVGLALGLALGAVNLYYSLEITRRDIAGLRLTYQFPIEIAISLVPVILGAAWIAALGPAESAVRGSLVEALEYE